uniref:aquaporin n=1 Tax=Salmonella enterica TaxID=28901 RepID=UPI00398C79C2
SAWVLKAGWAVCVEVVITCVRIGMFMGFTNEGNGIPQGPLVRLPIGMMVAVIGGSTGPLTGVAMNPARDFGPKLFTWLAGWGNIAMSGGRDIPYFIVPIVGTVIGVCSGAAIHPYFIGKHLPFNHWKPYVKLNQYTVK